jgi:hypothetical protein
MAYIAISTIGIVIVLGTSIGYTGNPALFLVSRYVICLVLFLLVGRFLLRPISKTKDLLSFQLLAGVITVHALVLILTALESYDGFSSGIAYSWWINFWYSASAAMFFNIDMYNALQGGVSYPVFLWLAGIPVAVIGPSALMYLGLRLKARRQDKDHENNACQSSEEVEELIQ